jgi:TonB family protein
MFDDTVKGPRSAHEVGRKLLALPAALAAHALVLGVLVIGQLWAVGAVQECAFVPPLIVHIPPPLGGDDGEKVKAVRKAIAKHTVRERLVQPPRVPVAAADTARSEPPSDISEVPGSVRADGDTGQGSGIGEGPRQPGVENGPSVEPPRQIGGDVKAPVAIAHPAPRYPELARRMRIEGVVIVDAVIDSNGNVVEARLRHDPGFGCGEAALQAIQSWKYEPATLNGRRVSVFLEVRVSFRLQDGE